MGQQFALWPHNRKVPGSNLPWVRGSKRSPGMCMLATNTKTCIWGLMLTGYSKLTLGIPQREGSTIINQHLLYY